MKIRCGSHQQNRSIVRPRLSLMATKVALTAEEFRENSQRSIDLFNTEKLSTDSTHVLKSAYCILCISAVAICTGRVEAKVRLSKLWKSAITLQSARGVWRQRRTNPAFHCSTFCCNLHGACGGKVPPVYLSTKNDVAICTGRVEAKLYVAKTVTACVSCNLHGACGGKGKWTARQLCWRRRCNLHGACGGKVAAENNYNDPTASLQSARGVWRQSSRPVRRHDDAHRCNLHGACGGKDKDYMAGLAERGCNLHGACGGKVLRRRSPSTTDWLQSARGVWRQRRPG